jgi:Domain of unknown function (DUF4157)
VRIVVQKLTAQQITKSSRLGRAHFGQSPELNSSLRSNAADLEEGSAAQGSTRFSHDFSQIALHPTTRFRIQPKFSTPGDKYEQEADRVSEQVMRMSEPRPQRDCSCGGGCPKCQTEQPGQEYDRVQTESGGSSNLGRTEVPPIILQVASSPGQSLDPAVRGFMEPRFKYDFGRVRIHADAVAAASAQAIDANAYTLGQHIVFGPGQYAPASDPGKRLLAHELAHVAQQRSDAAPLIARQPAQTPEQAHEAAHAAQPQQPATAQQGTCSKLDLTALQLPRKNNGGAEFFETTVKGIRFLAAVDAKQSSTVRANVKGAAEQIEKLNLATTDSASKVKLVIVTGGGSEFRSLCGQPVLLVDPQEFTPETAAHETMHRLTALLHQQSQTTGGQSAGAKSFLNKVADIYLQLNSLTIEKSGGVKVAATNLVDPQTLNPKERPEHPQDNMDEFLSSAVAVYLVYKKELEKKIQEFGKKDPKIKQLGKELMDLLGDFLEKQKLPAKQLPTISAAKDIEAETKKIKATPPVDDAVFVTHGLLTELLFPPKKTP